MDLLFGCWGNISCTTQWVVLSGRDSTILPSMVANHVQDLAPLSAHIASHIICMG